MSHVTGIVTQPWEAGGKQIIDIHPTQTFGERVPLSLMDWCPEYNTFLDVDIHTAKNNRWKTPEMN